MSITTRAARVLVGGLLTVAACQGADRAALSGGTGTNGGTVVIVIGSDVTTLLPPTRPRSRASWSRSCYSDRLAEIGDGLNTIGDQGFVPRLAEGWTWARDSLSIAFHLDPRARWHDGVPVRASDVRFTPWAVPRFGGWLRSRVGGRTH